MEYWFYHLEHTSLESALPTLLEKSLANDWRVRVQFGESAAMAHMDRYLWTYKEDSFLPHGREDQPGAEDHPIVLSATPAPANADVVFLIGAAQAGQMDGVKRCITMVDSRNEDSRMAARSRWKDAKDNGADVSYWQQDDRGKWAKRG